MSIEDRLEREWRDAVTKVVKQFSAELMEADAVSVCVFGLFARGHLTGVLSRGVDRLVLYVVLGLLAKSFKTHRALLALARQGLGEDATSLLRVLYETTTAIDFILRRASRRRALTYVAHAAHRRVLVLSEWRKTPGLKRSATKAAINRAEAHLNEVIGELPAGASFKGHWSGYGSFMELSRKLKWERGYQTFYRFASNITHGQDAGDHMSFGSGGALTLHILPGERHLAEVLATAPALLWIVTSKINTKFGLGYTNELLAARPREIKSGLP